MTTKHNIHTAVTIVPPAYPALEAEFYHLLDEVTDRITDIPPPSSQMGLELACAGVEVEG
jgi:hypothetical protein